MRTLTDGEKVFVYGGGSGKPAKGSAAKGGKKGGSRGSSGGSSNGSSRPVPPPAGGGG